MTCDSVREMLEAYALGALEPAERAQVEAHLKSCAECRQMARALADDAALLPQALAYASPLLLPASLKNRVLDAVQPSGRRDPYTVNRPPIRRPWFNWRTLGFALAALLLIVAFA